MVVPMLLLFMMMILMLMKRTMMKMTRNNMMMTGIIVRLATCPSFSSFSSCLSYHVSYGFCWHDDTVDGRWLLPRRRKPFRFGIASLLRSSLLLLDSFLFMLMNPRGIFTLTILYQHEPVTIVDICSKHDCLFCCWLLHLVLRCCHHGILCFSFSRP